MVEGFELRSVTRVDTARSSGLCMLYVNDFVSLKSISLGLLIVSVNFCVLNKVVGEFSAEIIRDGGSILS